MSLEVGVPFYREDDPAEGNLSLISPLRIRKSEEHAASKLNLFPFIITYYV